MYVHIFGYLVNKLEIWWVYLSPIENYSFYYFSNIVLHANLFLWYIHVTAQLVDGATSMYTNTVKQ